MEQISLRTSMKFLTATCRRYLVQFILSEGLLSLIVCEEPRTFKLNFSPIQIQRIFLWSHTYPQKKINKNKNNNKK